MLKSITRILTSRNQNEVKQRSKYGVRDESKYVTQSNIGSVCREKSQTVYECASVNLTEDDPAPTQRKVSTDVFLGVYKIWKMVSISWHMLAGNIEWEWNRQLILYNLRVHSVKYKRYLSSDPRSWSMRSVQMFVHTGCGVMDRNESSKNEGHTWKYEVLEFLLYAPEKSKFQII